MSYTIIILPKAERNLRKLARIDAKAARAVSLNILELEKDPYQPRPKVNIRKVEDKGYPPIYRLRVGSFRVDYAVFEKEMRILVSKIFRRSGDSDYK